MKKSVRISTDLLPISLRMRFNVLLNVAQARSIVQWEAVAPIAADVVVMNGEAVEAPPNTTVAMFIGEAAGSPQAVHPVQLQAAYNVQSLIAALDLAAVRVLNFWDTRRKSHEALATDSKSTFRLKHWVALDPEMATPAHSRVLAAMTRKGVTRDWILGHCTLGAAQIDALLDELQRRGAVHVASVPERSAVPREDASDELQAAGGFIGRLKRWLSDARTASPAKERHAS
jgi:hypothetical protein